MRSIKLDTGQQQMTFRGQLVGKANIDGVDTSLYSNRRGGYVLLEDGLDAIRVSRIKYKDLSIEGRFSAVGRVLVPAPYAGGVGGIDVH